MKLLSWNVGGRQRSKLVPQLEKVTGAEADVVALQEVTAATHDAWQQGLEAHGYSTLSSIDLLAAPYPGQIKRKNLNLVAARGDIVSLPGLSWPDADQAAVAFPEEHVAARIKCQGVAFELHNAHLPPGSSRGIIKPQAFRAIRRRIDEQTPLPQILCGDFNTPKAEDDDGVTPFGERHPGIQDWGTSELQVLQHPRLKDVYRQGHDGGAEFAVSHVTRGGKKRYDHVYANPDEWGSMSCRYQTDWLEARLSDHAAVEAVLAPRAA